MRTWTLNLYTMHEHGINLSAWHAHMIYCSNEQHVVIMKYRTWPLCLRGCSHSCITAWDKMGANEVVSSFAGLFPDCLGWVYLRVELLSDFIWLALCLPFFQKMSRQNVVCYVTEERPQCGEVCRFPSTVTWQVSSLSTFLINKLRNVPLSPGKGQINHYILIANNAKKQYGYLMKEYITGKKMIFLLVIYW